MSSTAAIVTLWIAATASASVVAAGPDGIAPDNSNAKPFEAAVSLSETLSSWSLAIIAGSIAILLSTSYHRPQNKMVRASYLAFVPGWLFLVACIFYGTQVQRVHLALLFSDNTNQTRLSELSSTIAQDAARQILCLKLGLAVFGLWLVVYLLWWIAAEQIRSEK
jgi:hypothetical protein